ncbi:MAG: hypothetical protein LPK11_01745 [Chromatiaceae bacterium]|nr:hypothetical protein [Chromatiaceae bacterium]
MNENLTKFLWVRLQSLFVSLIQYVCSSKDDFIHNVGKSSNDAFPLRAYLTIMKDKNGNEISVTVDVVNRNGSYFIEADICGEDGLILAEGPSAEMIELSEKELSSWLEEYESFLKYSQSLVKEKAAELE